jgi:hypothetical protein
MDGLVISVPVAGMGHGDSGGQKPDQPDVDSQSCQEDPIRRSSQASVDLRKSYTLKLRKNEICAPWADFSYIFSRGKSLSAENSVEFLGKTIFQNFFCGKFHFFPYSFFGGKFSAEFSPKIFPGKNVRKIGPLKSKCSYS